MNWILIAKERKNEVASAAERKLHQMRTSGQVRHSSQINLKMHTTHILRRHNDSQQTETKCANIRTIRGKTPNENEMSASKSFKCFHFFEKYFFA